MKIVRIPALALGQKVRIFGGLLLAVAGVLNMGVYLKAGGGFIVVGPAGGQ